MISTASYYKHNNKSDDHMTENPYSIELVLSVAPSGANWIDA